jgi:phosphomannomutase
MNKEIYIFDIDGTLAESGKNIDLDMILHLVKLKQSKLCYLAICGGGKYDKIMQQIDNSTIFDYIFSECGCVYYKYNNDEKKYDLMNKKNIRSHQLFNEINILIKHCLRFMSQVEYNLGGHLIDIRTGIVYISLIGMTALDNERNKFIELNKKYNYRNRLLDELIDIINKLGFENKIKVMIGGEVGITIMPIEYDKVQILDYLNDYSSIHYFGDKYLIGGNDYEIMTNNKVIAHPVNSIEDTKKILKLLHK